jgi:hypothetical protein
MDDNSLHRICTFVPLGHRSDPAGSTVRDLILMALSLSTVPRLSPRAIQASIKELTSGIVISQPEVDAALAALDANRTIVKHHEIADAFLYSVADERREKARTDLAVIDKGRTALLASFERHFSDAPDVSIRQNAARLVEGAEAYLKEVIRINGVLAAQSFYGGDAPQADLVPRTDDGTTSPIHLRAIRNAVTNCFRSTEPEIRKYVMSLIQAGVSYAALHLDPKCSRLLCRPLRMRETKVLVDTNIVFRLLGLNGEFFQQGALDVIRASKELGCQLLLSSETLREYKGTLKGHLAELQMKRLPKSKSLVDLLCRHARRV